MSGTTEAEETHISTPPFPELDRKATQNDKDTPSPNSDVSFWAHTSSVEAHFNHYGKTVDTSYPIPKWWLRNLYFNAPTTYTGRTPPKNRKRKDLEDLSPVSESAKHSPPLKKRRLSPPSSPCEQLTLRKAASSQIGSPLDDSHSDLPCPDSPDIIRASANWVSLLENNIKKLVREKFILRQRIARLEEELAQDGRIRDLE